ncbi:MAG: DUF4252 domain-containing protein [Cytophagales bacterium]|nr:DUF4252 domain-containing protein [Cytophagales bacterium]
MTKTIRIKSLFIGLVVWGLSQPLFAQEDILKDFAENRNNSKYCMYPSTLRMINLKNNEAYTELANSFRKFLIYEMDSITVAKGSHRDVMKKYRNEGFEEYVSLIGGGNEVLILGEEKRTNEMVGIFGMGDQVFVFYLLGNIQWQKIPTLINTFAENDLINIFDINEWD